MTNPPYEVATREDWVFALSVDGNDYRVVWTGLEVFETGYTDHFLQLFENGVEVSSSFKGNTKAVIEAVIAYRAIQLREEYNIAKARFANEVESYSKAAKDMIVALAERSWAQEYVGQYNNVNLYLETVAYILEEPLGQISRWVGELIDEKRIGLNGAILISYENYEASRLRQEAFTGHKEYDSTDSGDWGCGYCGAHAWAEEGVDPHSMPCSKDAYRSKIRF